MSGIKSQCTPSVRYSQRNMTSRNQSASQEQATESEKLDRGVQRSHAKRLTTNKSSARGYQRPFKHKPKRKLHRRGLPLSILLHGVILTLLAFLNSMDRPKDDVHAMVMRTAQTESIPLEQLQVQKVSPTVVRDAPEPVEIEEPFRRVESSNHRLQPQASVELHNGDRGFDPNPLSANFIDGSSRLSDTRHSLSKSFHGITHQGNFLIYIVDSSKSMGTAFKAAKNELLRSVFELESKQRFQVIFFDDQPLYYPPFHPDACPTAEPTTNANKIRFASWAASISMGDGAPPDVALNYALKLKPDVIFLLSDGAFSPQILDRLAEKNRLDNAFGDSRPISIINTIGYGRADQFETLRQMAVRNGGRFIQHAH